MDRTRKGHISYTWIPFVLFCLAAFPAEPKLEGIFFRPIYFCAVFAYFLYFMSPNWRISRLFTAYILNSALLIVYLIINGSINDNFIYSLREVIKVFVSVGIIIFSYMSVKKN